MRCAMKKLVPFLNPLLDFSRKMVGECWRVEKIWLLRKTESQIKQGRRWSWSTCVYRNLPSFKWYFSQKMGRWIPWWDPKSTSEFRWRVGWCWRKSRIDSCRLGAMYDLVMRDMGVMVFRCRNRWNRMPLKQPSQRFGSNLPSDPGRGSDGI